MRKKYLSALLFGALLVTSAGTFTSCKDYDDDINNLQEQIDKLATKEDMEAKLSQMQAAIDAAKATAEDALAKAEAAGDTEEIESLKARIQALEDAAIDVEALKNEISTAVDSQLSTFRTEIEELLAEMEEKLGLTVADMVTSVELVYSYADQNTAPVNVGFSTVVEKENVFGKDLTNAITFVKDRQVQVGGDFIVRVSPANAVLTPEMVSFVNSKGENLDEFLKVTKVEKYNELLSRSSNNNGLWKVSTELVTYNEDAFEKVTETTVNNQPEKVLFAVRVNNTSSATENREVISTYDLTFAWEKFTPLNTLNYWVNSTNVSDIRNRYDDTETGINTDKNEWKWINNADVAAAVNSDGTLVTGTGANAVQDTQDNRSDEPYIFPAVQGEAFTISIDEMTNTDIANYNAPSEIKGMYVTLDTRNAVESQPSEINAWNSYTYKGLNTVVEGTSIDVTIDGNNVIDDIIGVRVYAVNMDGTLVDPDGKAFYVRLGATAADWNAVNTTIVPDADDSTDADDEKSGKETVKLTKLTGAATATWTLENNTDPGFNTIFEDKDGNVLYNTNNLTSFPADFSQVAKIYTQPINADWTKYEDNKTYKGTLVIKNANDFVLATLDVTMTKVLPTTMPEGFSVKTAQVKDGIYNCYLVPNSWAAAQTPAATQVGTMDMDHVFNFGKGNEDQYEITFAESAMDGNKKVNNSVNGDDDLTVAINFIDNTTKHATTIAYNYGNISSDAKKNNDGKGYKVEAVDNDFETIFNCIYNDTYTWRWATREDLGLTATDNQGNYTQPIPYSTSLTYGTDKEYNENFAKYIQGISAWDGLYSAKLNAPYYKPATEAGSSLKIKEARVISNGNKEVDEYFKVIYSDNAITKFEATQTSSETNPTAAVESTLKITCYDMYGHEVVIELPMTVNRR